MLCARHEQAIFLAQQCVEVCESAAHGLHLLYHVCVVFVPGRGLLQCLRFCDLATDKSLASKVDRWAHPWYAAPVLFTHDGVAALVQQEQGSGTTMGMTDQNGDGLLDCGAGYLSWRSPMRDAVLNSAVVRDSGNEFRRAVAGVVRAGAPLDRDVLPGADEYETDEESRASIAKRSQYACAERLGQLFGAEQRFPPVVHMNDLKEFHLQTTAEGGQLLRERRYHTLRDYVALPRDAEDLHPGGQGAECAPHEQAPESNSRKNTLQDVVKTAGALQLSSSDIAQLSEEEQIAVYHESPLFLHGRSGTGKTTVLLHRAADHLEKTKDGCVLVVTASAHLASAIGDQFSKMQRSCESSTSSTSSRTMTKDQIQKEKSRFPACFQEATETREFLSVSFAQYLVMVDRTIADGQYFFEENAAFSDEDSNISSSSACSPRILQWTDRLEGRKPWLRKPGAEVTFPLFRDFYWPRVRSAHDTLFDERLCDSNSFAQQLLDEQSWRTANDNRVTTRNGGSSSQKFSRDNEVLRRRLEQYQQLQAKQAAALEKQQRVKLDQRISASDAYHEFLLIKGHFYQAPSTSTTKSTRAGAAKPLSELEYVTTPPKGSSAFLGEQDRRAVYAAFRRYCAMLKERREWDICDAASEIWARSLRYEGDKALLEKIGGDGRAPSLSPRRCGGGSGVGTAATAAARRGVAGSSTWSRPAHRVSCLLCDEAQDLLPCQLLLFQIVCEPDTECAFAGDTAQTIHFGRSFRFADLKDLWWKHFAPQVNLTNINKTWLRGATNSSSRLVGAGGDGEGVVQDQQAGKKVSKQKQRAMKANNSAKQRQTTGASSTAPPVLGTAAAEASAATTKVQFLTQNFRTHQGVLDFAALVVDVLYEFFARSVDRMPRETSAVSGVPPFLICGLSRDEFVAKLFRGHTASAAGSGGSSNATPMLGADQVILVQSEDAKQDVFAHFGPGAVVLTVCDSKGLEFDDVLLWNFFSESDCDEKCWLRLYDYMEREVEKLVADADAQFEKATTAVGTGGASAPGGATSPTTRGRGAAAAAVVAQKDPSELQRREDYRHKLMADVESLREGRALAKHSRKTDANSMWWSQWATALKVLYVGVTRAKKKILLYETAPLNPGSAVRAAKDFFADSRVLFGGGRAAMRWADVSQEEEEDGSTGTAADVALAGFVQKSDEGAYVSRGHEFFQRGMYREAKNMYSAGNDHKLAQRAEAQALAERGTCEDAAALFEEAGFFEDAAENFEKGGDVLRVLDCLDKTENGETVLAKLEEIRRALEGAGHAGKDDAAGADKRHVERTSKAPGKLGGNGRNGAGDIRSGTGAGAKANDLHEESAVADEDASAAETEAEVTEASTAVAGEAAEQGRRSAHSLQEERSAGTSSTSKKPRRADTASGGAGSALSRAVVQMQQEDIAHLRTRARLLWIKYSCLVEENVVHRFAGLGRHFGGPQLHQLPMGLYGGRGMGVAGRGGYSCGGGGFPFLPSGRPGSQGPVDLKQLDVPPGVQSLDDLLRLFLHHKPKAEFADVFPAVLLHFPNATKPRVKGVLSKARKETQNGNLLLLRQQEDEFFGLAGDSCQRTRSNRDDAQAKSQEEQESRGMIEYEQFPDEIRSAVAARPAKFITSTNSSELANLFSAASASFSSRLQMQQLERTLQSLNSEKESVRASVSAGGTTSDAVSLESRLAEVTEARRQRLEEMRKLQRAMEQAEGAMSVALRPLLAEHLSEVFFEAGRRGLVSLVQKLVLDCRVSVRTREKKTGNTILHVAVASRRKELLAWLLSPECYGAFSMRGTDDGYGCRSDRMRRMLQASKWISAENKKGETAIVMAIRSAEIWIAAEFFNHRDFPAWMWCRILRPVTLQAHARAIAFAQKDDPAEVPDSASLDLALAGEATVPVSQIRCRDDGGFSTDSDEDRDAVEPLTVIDAKAVAELRRAHREAVEIDAKERQMWREKNAAEQRLAEEKGENGNEHLAKLCRVLNSCGSSEGGKLFNSWIRELKEVTGVSDEMVVLHNMVRNYRSVIRERVEEEVTKHGASWKHAAAKMTEHILTSASLHLVQEIEWFFSRWSAPAWFLPPTDTCREEELIADSFGKLKESYEVLFDKKTRIRANIFEAVVFETVAGTSILDLGHAGNDCECGPVARLILGLPDHRDRHDPVPSRRSLSSCAKMMRDWEATDLNPSEDRRQSLDEFYHEVLWELWDATLSLDTDGLPTLPDWWAFFRRSFDGASYLRPSKTETELTLGERDKSTTEDVDKNAHDFSVPRPKLDFYNSDSDDSVTMSEDEEQVEGPDERTSVDERPHAAQAHEQVLPSLPALPDRLTTLLIGSGGCAAYSCSPGRRFFRNNHKAGYTDYYLFGMHEQKLLAAKNKMIMESFDHKAWLFQNAERVVSHLFDLYRGRPKNPSPSSEGAAQSTPGIGAGPVKMEHLPRLDIFVAADHWCFLHFLITAKYLDTKKCILAPRPTVSSPDCVSAKEQDEAAAAAAGQDTPSSKTASDRQPYTFAYLLEKQAESAGHKLHVSSGKRISEEKQKYFTCAQCSRRFPERLRFSLVCGHQFCHSCAVDEIAAFETDDEYQLMYNFRIGEALRTRGIRTPKTVVTDGAIAYSATETLCGRYMDLISSMASETGTSERHDADRSSVPKEYRDPPIGLRLKWKKCPCCRKPALPDVAEALAMRLLEVLNGTNGPREAFKDGTWTDPRRLRNPTAPRVQVTPGATVGDVLLALAAATGAVQVVQLLTFPKVRHVPDYDKQVLDARQEEEAKEAGGSAPDGESVEEEELAVLTTKEGNWIEPLGCVCPLLSSVDGKNALHYAVLHRQASVVKLLCENGFLELATRPSLYEEIGPRPRTPVEELLFSHCEYRSVRGFLKYFVDKECLTFEEWQNAAQQSVHPETKRWRREQMVDRAFGVNLSTVGHVFQARAEDVSTGWSADNTEVLDDARGAESSLPVFARRGLGVKVAFAAFILGRGGLIDQGRIDLLKSCFVYTRLWPAYVWALRIGVSAYQTALRRGDSLVSGDSHCNKNSFLSSATGSPDCMSDLLAALEVGEDDAARLPRRARLGGQPEGVPDGASALDATAAARRTHDYEYELGADLLLAAARAYFTTGRSAEDERSAASGATNEEGAPPANRAGAAGEDEAFALDRSSRKRHQAFCHLPISPDIAAVNFIGPLNLVTDTNMFYHHTCSSSYDGYAVRATAIPYGETLYCLAVCRGKSDLADWFLDLELQKDRARKELANQPHERDSRGTRLFLAVESPHLRLAHEALNWAFSPLPASQVAPTLHLRRLLAVLQHFCRWLNSRATVGAGSLETIPAKQARLSVVSQTRIEFGETVILKMAAKQCATVFGSRSVDCSSEDAGSAGNDKAGEPVAVAKRQLARACLFQLKRNCKEEILRLFDWYLQQHGAKINCCGARLSNGLSTADVNEEAQRTVQRAKEQGLTVRFKNGNVLVEKATMPAFVCADEVSHIANHVLFSPALYDVSDMSTGFWLLRALVSRGADPTARGILTERMKRRRKLAGSLGTTERTALQLESGNLVEYILETTMKAFNENRNTLSSGANVPMGSKWPCSWLTDFSDLVADDADGREKAYPLPHEAEAKIKAMLGRDHKTMDALHKRAKARATKDCGISSAIDRGIAGSTDAGNTKNEEKHEDDECNDYDGDDENNADDHDEFSDADGTPSTGDEGKGDAHDGSNANGTKFLQRHLYHTELEYCLQHSESLRAARATARERREFVLNFKVKKRLLSLYDVLEFLVMEHDIDIQGLDFRHLLEVHGKGKNRGAPPVNVAHMEQLKRNQAAKRLLTQASQ
eukprot:g11243.t1